MAITVYGGTEVGASSGATNTFDSRLQDGDMIWMMLLGFTTLSSGLTAGWTTRLAINTPSWTGAKSMWILSRTWSTGDATSVTLTGGVNPSWTNVYFRSNYARSNLWTVVAGTQRDDASDGGSSFTINQVSPTDADHDMRLFFCQQANTNSDVFHPLYPFGCVAGPQTSGSGSGPWAAIGRGPLPSDSGTMIVYRKAAAGTLGMSTMGFSMNDGDNNYSPSEDIAPLDLDATPGVWGLASRGGGDDSANARWEGGGARLLS